jgi:hypothetical protein
MPTSTTTRFTAGRGGQRPTVDISTRVSEVTYRRIQRQTIRPNTIRADTTRPALGGPGGTVQRLGGGAPLQPRADQGTGAIAVGGPLQYNQGIRAGQPASPITPTPTPQPTGWLQGEGDPNAANRVPRTRGDRYYDKASRTLWVWQQLEEEVAEWVVVARGTGERTIGIASPVAGNVYPVMAVADSQYLLLSLSIINRTETGEESTAGDGAVLVNDDEAIMGTTFVEPGDFVGLRVDDVGVGVLAASIVAGLA